MENYRMKLVETNDWKAVHFKGRTILRADRNLYPESIWQHLIHDIEVKEDGNQGHYIVVE